MENITILTRSANETKKLGSLLAKQILIYRGSTSIVISLEGELGSGKTTFTQGFARGLGIKEKIQSPTFVIMRIYRSHNFIHVDAYRLKAKDFKVIGWQDFLKNKNNIILVEWGDKIKNILPKNSLRILFKHGGHSQHRLIKIIT